MVQAITDEEKAAQEAFLRGVAGKLDWGRALAVRAQKAQSLCAAK